MDVVLGLDLGTSNFKALLCTKDGSLIGIGRVSLEPTRNNGVNYELSTEKFISILDECINLALIESNCSVDDIVGVSYSSQANSFLLLDAKDQPLTPIIIWSDSRSGAGSEKFNSFVKGLNFISETGMGFSSPNMALAKILWFKENQPVIWSKTSRIMTISDYLVFLLTGRKAGDSSTASLLGLWSLKNSCWWSQAFEKLGLDSEMFSECFNPGTVIGEVIKSASDLFSLPSGIPFAVGGLDHYMAALGSGIGFLGDFSESTGTILALCSLTNFFVPNKNISLGPGFGGGQDFYRLLFQDEGAVLLKEFQQQFSPNSTFSELSTQAGKTPPGSGGVFALIKNKPFSKKNNFIGQNQNSTNGMYVRALMEAIGASLKDLVDNASGSKMPDRILATGGGAQSDIWLQIKADMLGTIMTSVESPEPACTGAAMFASCAAGWAGSPKELSASWIKIRKEFYPDWDNYEYYQDWYGRYHKITTPFQ